MWISLALAAEPEVVATTPFVLDRPYRDAYRADHPTVSAGTLVLLRVEAGTWQARAVDDPVLWAGPRPVAIAARTPTCLAAIVPADVDLASEPLFRGPADLPERVTPSRGADVRKGAIDAGLKPALPLDARRADPVKLADEGAIYAEAARRVGDCQSR
jgi:hypothetical protein